MHVPPELYTSSYICAPYAAYASIRSYPSYVVPFLASCMLAPVHPYMSIDRLNSFIHSAEN